MNLTGLSIADVYAIKEQAKTKQVYYTGLFYAAELSGTERQEFQAKANLLGALITEADTELTKRIGL